MAELVVRLLAFSLVGLGLYRLTFESRPMWYVFIAFAVLVSVKVLLGILAGGARYSIDDQGLASVTCFGSASIPWAEVGAIRTFRRSRRAATHMVVSRDRSRTIAFTQDFDRGGTLLAAIKDALANRSLRVAHEEVQHRGSTVVFLLRLLIAGLLAAAALAGLLR